MLGSLKTHQRLIRFTLESIKWSRNKKQPYNLLVMFLFTQKSGKRNFGWPFYFFIFWVMWSSVLYERMFRTGYLQNPWLVNFQHKAPKWFLSNIQPIRLQTRHWNIRKLVAISNIPYLLWTQQLECSLLSA